MKIKTLDVCKDYGRVHMVFDFGYDEVSGVYDHSHFTLCGQPANRYEVIDSYGSDQSECQICQRILSKSNPALARKYLHAFTDWLYDDQDFFFGWAVESAIETVLQEQEVYRLYKQLRDATNKVKK